MLRVVAFDMTPQNRSSLRHPGSAPAAPPPRSRIHGSARRSELPRHHVEPNDRSISSDELDLWYRGGDSDASAIDRMS